MTQGDGPLTGLRVVDLSTRLSGALATMFLADAGADVLLVERSGGSPLRRRADWPVIGRGKQSIELDWDTDLGRQQLDELLDHSDVLITTASPATCVRHRLTAESLDADHPHLVSASITGFGWSGPLASVQGHEPLVMAKLGYNAIKRRMAGRPGPAFVSVPFASFGAAHTAVHGVLAAVLERDRSGRGQQVRADMVRGVGTIDTWDWYTQLVGVRWPGAYTVVEAFNDQGEVQAPLAYPLLIAPTSDGHWLQFAQVQPRLFASFMEELGLDWMWQDPKWAGLPALPTQELRSELWEAMITAVGSRSLAEWEATFERNRNLMAERFRPGADVLAHPQLVHDQRSVVVDDPEVGPVRQPTTLAHSDRGPLRRLKAAPRLGEHDELPARPSLTEQRNGCPSDAPLTGVTILDFGLMFAGPYGATLLADLGARVIKIETLEGDTIRRAVGFPEVGGAKVMQGKESICVDLSTEEGKEVIRKLVSSADVVLQAYRAGAAARIGVDPASLQAINPRLVYVSAPGYGTSGPCGDKPAYAPSIGAAGGLALTDAPDAVEVARSIPEVKRTAVRLNSATAIVPLQVDGLSALAVASTILLGLVARSRGHEVGPLNTSMLATASHAVLAHTIDWPGRQAPPVVDEGSNGIGALCRLYRASDGWICLAAARPSEWESLVAALLAYVDLGSDPRFNDARGREGNDDDLAATLSDVFVNRPASVWEKELQAAGVGCVEVGTVRPQELLQTIPALAEEYAVTVTSPVFDDHLRPGPATLFSRSATTPRGFCEAGAHTDSILSELGYDAAEIAELRSHKVVG